MKMSKIVSKWLSEYHSNKQIDGLSQVDFSSMSKIKDTLKDKLIERIRSQSAERMDEDELDIEELDQVAGGLNQDIDVIKNEDQ